MLKLRSTITPDMCPFLTETITVNNKKTVRIRGGTLTFYCTPELVVVIMKTVAAVEWDAISRSTYQTKTFEIKTVPKEIWV